MRIKDNEDKKSKIENDLQLVREEKNDLESSLKAATGKIQQNDKGMDFNYRNRRSDRHDFAKMFRLWIRKSYIISQQATKSNAID